MSTQEIIEGNKLIAEFMGFDFIANNSHFIVRESDYLEPYHHNFHKSWDWLIPTISKAHETNEYSKYVDETCNLISDGGIFINTKFIESTFENVVDFVKWYNKNK